VSPIIIILCYIIIIMGRGGGPITIPEAVIEEAFNKGEDFTISENEIAILTEPLEVPTGSTLLVEGTIDLGEGNILNVAVGSTLKLDGGTLTNTASDVEVSGILTSDNGQINIAGDLTVKSTGTAEFAGDNEITCNGLIVEAGGKLSGVGSSTKETLNMDIFSFLFAGMFGGGYDTVPGDNLTIKIRENGEFKVTTTGNLELAGVTLDLLAEGITTEIKGSLKLINPKLGDEVTGIVKNEILLGGNSLDIVGSDGKILTETDMAINKLETNMNRIENGTINITKGGTMSGNFDIEDTNISIGSPDGSPDGSTDSSALILGYMNENKDKFTRRGTLTYTVDDEADVTVHNFDGIKFVKGSITSVPLIRSVFPQGENSEAASPPDTFTYLKLHNPGFNISSTGSGWPTVVEYDAIDSSTTKKININMTA
jgi:hypothetical protein